jgi:ribosomal protein S2
MARKKQEKLFEDDPLDPAIAKVADRYVELVEERAANKEAIEVQERNLTGMMKNAGLTKIRHKGHTLELVHNEKDKILLKKEKDLRKARQRVKDAQDQKEE